MASALKGLTTIQVLPQHCEMPWKKGYLLRQLFCGDVLRRMLICDHSNDRVAIQTRYPLFTKTTHLSDRVFVKTAP